MGWSTRRSQATNPPRSRTPPSSAPTTAGRRPAVHRPLDDRPEDQAEPADREQGAGRIGAPGLRAPRVGDEQRSPHQAGGDHRDVDQEDRAPPEVGEQQPPGHRADGDPQPDGAGPDADGPGPLAGVAEDVVDDREAGGDGHRRARPHQPSPGDQRSDAAREGGAQGAAPEDGEAGEEEPLAPVPVGHAPGDQEQAAEHHGVGVDDPLELVGGGLQLLDQGGQGHVQDGVVQVDHQDGDAEDGERGPARLRPTLRARGSPELAPGQGLWLRGWLNECSI